MAGGSVVTSSEAALLSSIHPLLEVWGYMIYSMLITDVAGELVLHPEHQQNRKRDVFYACQ